MKVTTTQIQNGVLRFIDSEIIPHIDGWGKIGVGVISVLVSKNFENIFNSYKNHPVIAMLGIVDTNTNEIDIDGLYNAAIDYIGTEPMPIDVPLLGRIKVKKSDFDTLVKMIKEG